MIFEKFALEKRARNISRGDLPLQGASKSMEDDLIDFVSKQWEIAL